MINECVPSHASFSIPRPLFSINAKRSPIPQAKGGFVQVEDEDIPFKVLGKMGQKKGPGEEGQHVTEDHHERVVQGQEYLGSGDFILIGHGSGTACEGSMDLHHER